MKQTNTILLLTIILLWLIFGCTSRDNKKLDRTNNLKIEKIPNETVDPISTIRLLDMKSNNLTDNVLKNENGPLMIVFWATTCGPCIKELNTISPLYEKWKKEYNLKLIAVSPEYLRQESINQLIKKLNTNKDTLLERQNLRFQKFIGNHNYDFDLFLDSNDELTNFLHSFKGIDTTYIRSGYFNGQPRVWTPQTVIIDKEGNLIKQKVGFNAGDEIMIENILTEMKQNAL